jgi:hypothetical protein
MALIQSPFIKESTRPILLGVESLALLYSPYIECDWFPLITICCQNRKNLLFHLKAFMAIEIHSIIHFPLAQRRIQRANHVSNQGNVGSRRVLGPECAAMDSGFRCRENGARCVAQAWPVDRSWKCRPNQGASWKWTLYFPGNTVKNTESSPRYSSSNLNRGT